MCVPLRSGLLRSALLRSALLRSALLRSALLRSALQRSALLRSALQSSALLRHLLTKSENAFLFYALFIYRDCNFNVKWIEELEDCNYLEHVTQFAEENPEINLSESAYSITPILNAILNEYEQTSEEQNSEEQTSEEQTSEEQTSEESTYE